MRYIAMTTSECAAFIQGNSDFARWEFLRQFAQGAYGDKAQSAELIIDFGHYETSGGGGFQMPMWIETIIVRDDQGQPLSPNPHGIFWRSIRFDVARLGLETYQHALDYIVEHGKEETEGDMQFFIASWLTELNLAHGMGLIYGISNTSFLVDFRQSPLLTQQIFQQVED